MAGLTQGPLGQGVLPGLLRDLYVGRKTGYLYFTRPSLNCSVLFRQGHIVHASTDDPQDWLGEVLVREGLLSREAQQQAAAQAEKEKKRLGRVLLDSGILPQATIEDGMARQVRQILYRVFSWDDGNYRFEPLSAVKSLDVTLKVSTGDMILEAVRRMSDPDAVRRAFGDLDLPLALSSDPLLRFQNITLSESERYVLSSVDGTLSARQVTQAVPLDPDVATRGMFGLLCTGVIERLPPRARAMPAAAPASPAAAPPAAEAPPAAAPDGAELDARRREIVELSERLGTRSHYEILEVARTATDAEIKEAYFRRARRFHPDVHHHTGLADLAPRLEAVFIRLGDAYEALRYKHSRASYDRSLGMVTPSPQAAPSAPAAEPAAPAPPPAAPADPAFERRRAAEQVRIGERHLQESRYWDAIQCFEGALDYVDGALKQRALLGLARGLMRNPNWVKRAEETLQELLRLSPRHVDGLLELGLLYKASGLKSRALAVFRRVLEVEPAHEQALAQITELEPPPPPEDPGLLKKLFGRR